MLKMGEPAQGRVDCNRSAMTGFTAAHG